MAKNIALGSRPKSDYEKKLVGIVHVTTGKTEAKLVLQEEGKTFKNGEDSIRVKLDTLPKRPRLAKEDKVGKEYRVRMNQDGDEVEAFTPVRGHFTAKLVDLGPRPDGKDSDPMPFEKTFTRGDKEESHLEFFAVYEIIGGAFDGVQLPAYWLHYKFEQDPQEEEFTRFAGNFENKKATRLFQLRDWGLAHKLWDEPIPWDDDTILPTLLERALDSDVQVEITLDKGYIILVQAEESYEESENGESEDDVDREFPKKESKPSPKKPATKKSPPKSKHDDEDDDL